MQTSQAILAPSLACEGPPPFSLWGPSFPAQFSLEALSKQYPQSQITVRVHTALKSKQTRVSLQSFPSRLNSWRGKSGMWVQNGLYLKPHTGATLQQLVRGSLPITQGAQDPQLPLMDATPRPPASDCKASSYTECTERSWNFPHPR